ncbi:MAG: response regulator transcription factor [bacterium]|nr:response regulator transcription factor [bacterium]
MNREMIYIVEDEDDIAELERYNLIRDGYRVKVFGTGEAALEQIKTEPPDLLLLDLMLPGIDGLTVCRRIKNEFFKATFPVIMVTAKGEEADIVTGLELGADDYIVKPFSPRVLLARVKSVLRRQQTSEVEIDNESIKHDAMSILPDRHEVIVEGKPVKLTGTEFRILYALVRRVGRVFTRYQLVDFARGGDAMVTDRSIDVHIVAIRRKLGEIGKLIETVHGVGYRCKE